MALTCAASTGYMAEQKRLRAYLAHTYIHKSILHQRSVARGEFAFDFQTHSTSEKDKDKSDVPSNSCMDKKVESENTTQSPPADQAHSNRQQCTCILGPTKSIQCHQRTESSSSLQSHNHASL